MMSILEQYGLLLALVLGIAATVLALFGIARAMGPTRREPGKDVPASSGVLSRDPVWGPLSRTVLRLRAALLPSTWKWHLCTPGQLYTGK